MSNGKLAGKWALITGASSGIGKALAHELAMKGANLILTARRREKLEELSGILNEKYKIETLVIDIDLGKAEGASILKERIHTAGILPSIIINNAGKGHFGPFDQFGLDEHLSDIQLNINSLVAVTHLLIPLIKQAPEPRHIMNVSSVVSYVSLPNYAVYSGTKRFVRHFSEALKFELKKDKIEVSCLCPGGTQTEFMENAGQVMGEGSESVLMGPEEVARIGVEGMLKGKTSIVTGLMNKVFCFLPRILPTGVTVGLSDIVMSKYASSERNKEEM